MSPTQIRHNALETHKTAACGTDGIEVPEHSLLEHSLLDDVTDPLTGKPTRRHLDRQRASVPVRDVHPNQGL